MRNSASSVVASRAVSVLCGMLTLVITARGLGPDGRGLVATATSVLLLAPLVASFGLPMTVQRAAAATDLAASSLTLGAAKAAGAWIGLATALIGLSMHFVTGTPSVPLALALGVCTTTGIWWLSDAGALLGRGRVGAYASVLLLPSLLLVTMVGLLASLQQLTVESAISAQVVAYVLTATHSTRLTRTSPLLDIHAQWQTLRSAVQYMGGQIAEALSYRLDQAMAILFVGPGGAGQYSIAATIGMLPSTLGLAVSAATFNEVAARPMIDGHPNLKAVRVAFLSALPATLGAGITAPLVIPALFGDDFRPAAPATLVALAGSQCLVLAQGAASLLIALGRGWYLSLAQIIGLVVGIGLLATLGPIWGVLGAAIASTVGFATAALLALSFLRARPSDLWLRRADLASALGTFTTGRL